MKVFEIHSPQSASVVERDEPAPGAGGDVHLRVRLVGMCGTDLTTYRGGNAMVAFPRVPGHEVAATVISGGTLAPGTAVTMSPYTSCGECASCRRDRPNACQHNQTMGVQRDGAMTEYLQAPNEKLFTANLSLKALALVEPLTVGAHAAALLRQIR